MDFINNVEMSNTIKVQWLINLEDHITLNDISIDFLNLPESNTGKESVMVIVCRLSKMCKIITCTKELKTDEAGKLFWDNIVCNFGLPATIVSDRDKLFASDL
ncbi:hypothetical protein ACTFIW_000772 [Dictyostelium discoideum]